MVQRLIFISITAIFLACTSSNIPITPDTPTLSEAVTLNTADSLWELRADTLNAKSSLMAYKQLAESDSSSLEIWAKLSKAYYYCAQYLHHSSQVRDSLFMLGYETSQTILKQNSDYRNLLFSTGEESMAVRGLDLNSVDALYWGMANHGQWLSTKGTLVRLGKRELIWTTLEHIHDLDSSYYHGAYFRYKGALLARDPQSQTDLEAIRLSFEKAISLSPEYLGNYTLMAQYYCPLAKDKNLFYELLTKVVTATPNQSLSYYPENMAEKELAERLMIKAEKENWFNL